MLKEYILKNITLIILIITLTGCATRYWYNKPGVTIQERNQDYYQCQKESTYQQSGAVLNVYGGVATSGHAVDNNMVQSCLRAKGYRVENYKF